MGKNGVMGKQDTKHGRGDMMYIVMMSVFWLKVVTVIR
jgi:hypothetical protein